MIDHDDLELAGFLGDIGESEDDPALRRRVGTVTAATGSSYTVTVAGSPIPAVRSLVPLVVGDVVELVFDGRRPLAIGQVDAGWLPLTLQNGWVNFGGEWAGAGYRKVNGVVFVRGLIKNGSTVSLSVIANLPAGYRVASNQGHHIPTVSNDVFSYKRIHSSGDITVGAGASAVYFDLSCSFIAEQ